MPSTNLSAKTKADLVQLAEISGLLTNAQAKKMTRPELLSYLKQAETESAGRTAVKKTAPAKTKSTEKAAVKAPRKTKKTTAEQASDTATTTKRTTQRKASAPQDPVTDTAAVKKPKTRSARKSENASDTGAGNNAEDSAKPAAPSGRKRGRKPTTAASDQLKEPAAITAVDANAQPITAHAGDGQSEADKSIEPASVRPAAPSIDPVISSAAESDSKSTAAVQSATPSADQAVSAPAASDSSAIRNDDSISDSNDATTSESPAQVKQNNRPVSEHTSMRSGTGSERERGRSRNPQALRGRSGQNRPMEASNSGRPNRTADARTAGRQNRPMEARSIDFTENSPEPESVEKADRLNVVQGTAISADGERQRRPIVEAGEMVAGTLEIMPDGYGFLRKDNYLQGSKDIYVPPQYIRRFGLRTGDLIVGPGKTQRETDRYQALLYIKEVNGMPPEKMVRRPQFDRLTPIYPDERYHLETTRNELSTRIIDLAAPIGKGQRGMIVSPPKAGKTILLQKIANAISINNPEVKLIVLLIDERPEEVTDMQRSIKGEVVYSTFDKTPENHVKVTELVLERAMRLVELKQDVVILLDSMTRLGRAYNLTINPTGRTLSGGLDPGALYGPKRFFGAARNIENGGSLTIIATSLIETGSRMDEVIFEEFKGTGNMEVILDRKLSEKRIFPAIDINRSGTRREELLMTSSELDAVWTIRKAFSQLDTASVTETIINLLLKTQNNEHFISSINVSFNDKNVFDAMRGTKTGAGNAGSGSNGNSGGYGNGQQGSGPSNGYNSPR